MAPTSETRIVSLMQVGKVPARLTSLTCEGIKCPSALGISSRSLPQDFNQKFRKPEHASYRWTLHPCIRCRCRRAERSHVLRTGHCYFPTLRPLVNCLVATSPTTLEAKGQDLLDQYTHKCQGFGVDTGKLTVDKNSSVSSASNTASAVSSVVTTPASGDSSNTDGALSLAQVSMSKIVAVVAGAVVVGMAWTLI